MITRVLALLVLVCSAVHPVLAQASYVGTVGGAPVELAQVSTC